MRGRHRLIRLIPAVSIIIFAAFRSRETETDAGDVKVVVYLAVFETRPYVPVRVFASREALEGKESRIRGKKRKNL